MYSTYTSTLYNVGNQSVGYSTEWVTFKMQLSSRKCNCLAKPLQVLTKLLGEFVFIRLHIILLRLRTLWNCSEDSKLLNLQIVAMFWCPQIVWYSSEFWTFDVLKLWHSSEFWCPQIVTYLRDLMPSNFDTSPSFDAFKLWHSSEIWCPQIMT